MASGFIIFKDGRCFARRWTGYDEIIRIAIKELRFLKGGEDLAVWLETLIPDLNIKEDEEAGWGFYKFSLDDWITRELDLRSLTDRNRQLFWEAIKNSKIKILKEGPEYSRIDIDFFEVFFKMFELSENGFPPMELNDWTEIADVCTEKNGPGWDKQTT